MCLLNKIAEVSRMVLRGTCLESLEGHIRNLLGVDLMANLCPMDRTDRVTSPLISSSVNGTLTVRFVHA